MTGRAGHTSGGNSTSLAPPWSAEAPREGVFAVLSPPARNSNNRRVGGYISAKAKPRRTLLALCRSF